MASEGMRGRVALVSGGGSGIGREIALALALAGARVHVAGRSPRALETADEIRRRGQSAVGHCGSVAEPEFGRQLVAVVERDEGRLDLLVNAAAVLGPVGPFWELDMTGFAETLHTNLMGSVHLMRWALPGMLARGFGRIVNFAGGGAAYAYPRFSPYGISKCALVRLSETVAEELAGSPVTVNVIAPGAVETGMLAQVRQHGGEVRTVTDVQEAVRLVMYLAGEAAATVSGRFLHVRDRYQDPQLYRDPEMLKLRRKEIR